MLENVTIGYLLLCFCGGLISGIVFCIIGLLKKIIKNNLIVCWCIDTIRSLICCFVFVFIVFKYNFGQFSVFPLVFFVLGIVILQNFVKKLFARVIIWVYNKVTLKRKKISNTKEG